MRPFLFFLSCLPGLALAEACIVHSQAKNLDVKVCQQNRSIPAKLFREGFCQPQLQGQKVEVTFAEECPTAPSVSAATPGYPTRPIGRTSSTTASRPTHATWSRSAPARAKVAGKSLAPRKSPERVISLSQRQG